MNNFKTSRFNICFSKSTENKYYIYNTLTTALLQIDGLLFSSLEKGNIPELCADSFELLKPKGFIVSNNSNEAEEYLYYYNHTRFCESAGLLKLVIIPTYHCNLACAYCLQGKGEQTAAPSQTIKTMKIGDAEKIITFMQSRISYNTSEVPLRKISITFHGGEPLSAFKICKYIAENASRLASQYSLPLVFSMSSNLTLLSPDIISFIKKYDVNVQVTIDGNEAQHNARRHFSNKEGTYALIVRNLAALTDQGLKKNVVIRINLDSETVKNADEIIDGVRKYSDDIYFGYLHIFKGKNESYSSKCLNDSCYSVNEAKLAEIYKRYRLPIPASFGKKGPCSMNCENKFYIDPGLEIYKCELLINHPQYKTGYLNDNAKLINLPQYFRQMSWSPALFKKCLDCILLPCCAGGCPALGKDYYDEDILNAHCQFSIEELTKHLENYVAWRD